MFKNMQLTARKQLQKQHLLIVASHYYHYKQHNYFCPNLKIFVPFNSKYDNVNRTEMNTNLIHVKS